MQFIEQPGQQIRCDGWYDVEVELVVEFVITFLHCFDQYVGVIEHVLGVFDKGFVSHRQERLWFGLFEERFVSECLGLLDLFVQCRLAYAVLVRRFFELFCVCYGEDIFHLP